MVNRLHLISGLSRSGLARRSAIFLIAVAACAFGYSSAQGQTKGAEASTAPRVVKHLKVEKYINAVAWNSDGSRLAALSNFGGTITVWDTSSWTIVRQFNRYGGAYSFNSFSFLGDRELLTNAPIGKSPDPHYATLGIFALALWDVKDARVIRYIPNVELPTRENGYTAFTFTVSPSESKIATTNLTYFVTLYRAQDGGFAWRVRVPNSAAYPDVPRSLSFSPNGSELAVGTMDGKIYLFRTSNATLEKKLNVFDDGVHGCDPIGFDFDGELLAVGSYKNINSDTPMPFSVEILRVSDGAIVAVLPPDVGGEIGRNESAAVRGLAWKPNSKILAFGDDKTLQVWSLDRSKPAQLLNMPARGIYSVRYSSRGVLAVSHENEITVLE